MNMHMQREKALIIGGGIAGLLVARILSDLYSEVLVIERDTQPEGPEARPGAPQSFHLHQVLPRGEQIIEGLFPGFLADLRAGGAYHLNSSLVQMTNLYGTIPFPGDGEGLTYNRGLLEWVIRQRVHAIPNVRFLYHQEVLDLTTTPDRQRVTGIHVRERGQLGQQTTLTGDLVIEASGRSSKLPQWLTALGYELAEDERVSSGIGYTTRYYKIPPQRKHIAVHVIDPDPSSGYYMGGVLKAIEGDRWVVCLGGAGGQYPSTNVQEFEEGFKHLLSPTLAELIQDAEPLTEPRGYRLPECVRHHYERMKRWPSGLLVLGDAFCSFDPIYGQGMTVAAMEVGTLATCLREDQQPGFEQRALQRIQDAIYPAWWRSTIEDLRWPGVSYSGPEPIKDLPLLHRYFALCLKQSTRKLVQLLQKGEFNPLFMSNFLMNWLFISPRSVINVDMLNSLLEDETPEEKQATLDWLFEGYDQQNSDSVLAQAVPDFALNMGAMPAAPIPEEEPAL